MGEVTYTVPVVGEAVTSAEPNVDTALTQLKTQINGKLSAANLEANAVTSAKILNEAVTTEKIKEEAVTGKKLGAGAMREPEFTEVYVERSNNTEYEPSATRPSWVILSLGVTINLVGEIVVEGKKIGTFAAPTGTEGTIGPMMTFPVRAGKKWKVNVTSGAGLSIHSTYVIC